MVSAFLKKFEGIRPFTDNEAWGLFRLAAFAEAIGWSLLIIALLINHFSILGSGVAIPIAGRIHGMFFLIYFGILFSVYSSLSWSRQKFLLAIVAGIPPFGSLLFEVWITYTRHAELYKTHLSTLILRSLTESIND